MSTGKRTLAFQVSEEFFTEVQEFVRGRGIKLKDFGIAAMKKMMEDAEQPAPPADAATAEAATDSQETA